MSRRPQSAGIPRPGVSRAPSLTTTRLSRAPSSNNMRSVDEAGSPVRRRRLSTAANAAGSVRMPSTTPETNINVVVRCRGRSAPELAEGSPEIVTCGGPLSKNITVETSPSAVSGAATFTTASAYAGAGHPNTRTYPFDKVFGPEADQTMLFNEVAEGMLDEVLAGFNCTIFAYGQTGTGKTYTMQGDTVPTQLMAPSHDAGIIPRVLHKLFAVLESQENAEYAVKCSYIELYNEELRDLLAPEYTNSVGNNNIKIFEDSSKKGVTVQGVEEAGLRNLKDGLAALAKGTNRRQTAETKMNSESSRSHSIFTLTVHVRENGVDKGDEDLLRIGKFNLVDLAGSEAIGRSGAENKRAREAGMINQSLLTLGRVISALVDKGSHIPYRESKLTRLLQDSLGGRTKTCIIATVSPTRSNMEETLSTLDYALRAKSIKNKPEVNAHLTKAGLLKEYVADIERLKAELFATREKNGIWIPEDQYKEMQQTQTKQKSDYDYARQRVATIEVELKTRKAEFDLLTNKFITTTEELSTARESERQLSDLVEQAKVDVERMRIELGEAKFVADAFEAGEEHLHNVASELRGVATESVRDVGGLFAKLGRLTDVLDTNTDGATRFGTEMQTLSADLRTGIQEMYGVQEGFSSVLQDKMLANVSRCEAEATQNQRELDAAWDAFDELAEKLTTSIDEGKADAGAAAAQIMEIKNEVQANVRTWSQNVAKRSTQMVEDLLAHQEKHLGVVGSVLDTSTKLLDAVITAARDNIAAQTRTFETAKQLASSAADAEISRLRAQNDLLTRLLNEEQAKSAALRTDLIANISSMIVGFTEAQDASLRTAVNQVKAANETGITQMQGFTSQHTGAMDACATAAREFSRDLETRSAAVEGQRGEGQKALGNVTTRMRQQLGEYAKRTASEAEEHVTSVDQFCTRLGNASSKLSTDSEQRAAFQRQTVQVISQSVDEDHERASKRARRNADEASSLASALMVSHNELLGSATEAHDAAQDRVSELESSTARFLTGIAIDEPTGETPRKRSYPMPTWERTQPRQMLIAAHRRAHANGSSSATFDAPRLSTGSASTVSESTVCSPVADEKSLPRVSSTLSIASLKSTASASSSSSDALASSTGTSNIIAPVPLRQMSASALGVPRLVSPKRIGSVSGISSNGSVNGLPRKLSRDGEKERPVQGLSVLGDGGNVPRPRRR